MIFRKADQNDIEQLAMFRRLQLRDEGLTPDPDAASLKDFARFIREKMDSGELVEWVAEEDGKIIATAAVLFMEFPPVFNDPTGMRGYITNMYTDDEYRGQGIAGKLLEIMDDEARARGVTRMTLHASVLGKKAYVKSGYKETDLLMEKYI